MRFRVISLALLVLAAALAAATSARAQTIGNYIVNPNSGVVSIQRPFTVIDLGSPATSAGSIAVVAVRSLEACTSAIKVKFFHHASGVYTPYAERGPFDITHPLMVLHMSPAVTVTTGDVIGLVSLQDCSRLAGQVPLLFSNAAQFSGDVSAPVSLSSAVSILPNFALAAFGAPSANTEVRTQVLIGAGAGPGAFGASFKTDLFVTNTRPMRSAGRIVYHPEETSGKADDPSISFIVDPHMSITYPNFLQTRLGLTGKGSVDIYTRIGNEAPTVSARVYEEGSGGTKGFTLDALPESDALDAIEQGVLFVPSDATKFRMNIGLRTLDVETQIEFDLFDSGGGLRTFVTKTYPANYYVQTDFKSLFGVDFQPGDTVVALPRRGAAYVYGSTVDNTSNDPSAQIARPLE